MGNEERSGLEWNCISTTVMNKYQYRSISYIHIYSSQLDKYNIKDQKAPQEGCGHRRQHALLR